jgi:excinuclease ABC subunit B
VNFQSNTTRASRGSVERDQVLLGVTGSGKTFTMAKVIEETQRPALILAPNKTLAAQLYGEFKSFFPDNAVEYFVSYYDYYQPEAYVPRTDTYIEKESSINEQIDRMRHSATRALLERDDVIIVASVSCIYGIGSVETYTAMTFQLEVGERIDQRQLLADLVALQYKRNDINFQPRLVPRRGDTIESSRPTMRTAPGALAVRRRDRGITEFDPLTGQKTGEAEERQDLRQLALRHAAPDAQPGHQAIKAELKSASRSFQNAAGRLLEAQRLEQRTQFDMEMLGHRLCAGIENYSRYLTGRKPGEPPPTLFEYLPDNALVFADESHQSPSRRSAPCSRRLPPQGDAGRIRLPPALLHGQPAAALRGMGRHAPADGAVSATPGPGSWSSTGGVFAEQVIRPTGLIDPPVESARRDRPQVDDLLGEVKAVAAPATARCDDADQAHGRGPDRIPARKRRARALHALRHRHAGADRDHPRPAPRRVRRAGRHQPAARGARHPRVRAGRHSRCRQGRLPALRDLAHPDHRPRGAQRRRQGDPLCRQGDRLDGARHGRDRPPPRKAAGLQ